MSNKIVYRKEKGFQLTSNEVDGNFKYLDERIDKVAEKDYFVFDAGYSKSGNVVTVNAGSKWKVKGNEIGNDVPFSFAIDSASVGCYRVDVVCANDKGQFEIATGVESANGYVVGRVEQLQYVLVYVSDQGIQSVGDSNSDFVSKLSFGWVDVDHKEMVLRASEQKSNINIVGGNKVINGVANGVFEIVVPESFHDGYCVSIRNGRNSYLTLVNSSKLRIYTGQNYTIRPGEIVSFKYDKKNHAFEISGALDIRLDWQNVDDVIGVDSLRMYIDSSSGDALNPNNLNTKLTPTILRYFKDYTNESVGWKWSRFSGDEAADTTWAVGKNKRVLDLVPEDFTASIHTGQVSFMAEAVVNESVVSGVWVAKLVDQAKTIRIQSTGTQFKGSSPEYILLKAVINNFKHKKIEWFKDGKLTNINGSVMVYNNQVSSYVVITLKVTGVDDVVYEDTITLSKVVDGKPGVDGKNGAVPVWVEWMTGDKHYNNDKEVFYIYHRPTETVWKLKDGQDNVVAPANPDDRYVRQPHLEQVVTKVLVAEGANIAGFIFKDGKLVSQYPSVDNPNIILDGVTGKVIFKDAEVAGSITIGNGSPAWNQIDSKIEDQTIYIEYSIDGKSNWHANMLTTDVYMRQKKGSGNWGQAVRIAGRDGVKGDKGDTGAQGIQGLQGIKGDQGIAGVKGADGQTSYTHIAYADTAVGGGFSQNPANKTYIGMYVDFVSQDSTDPAKYKWSLIKGADGKNGVPGTAGADGKTPYFHTAWANSQDGKVGFSTTVSAGKTHIGTYTDFTQADSTDSTKYSWSQIKGDKGDTGSQGVKGDTGAQGIQGLQGIKGDQGIAGVKGADGQTSYTHIAYADTAVGGGFSQNPANKTYIGMYVDFVSQDSTDPAKYKWSLIKGADGKNGVPGTAGADGKTPYFHTAWANSQDGKVGFSTTVSAGKTHIGTYTDFTQADSTDSTKYSWSQIKGDKGDTGSQGVKGTDGKNGESLGDGFIMFRDPTFKNGSNNISSYVGAIPVRIVRPNDAPTDSTHIIRFTNTGEVGSNNRWAGAVQTTKAKANGVYVHKIVAKIPKGYSIQKYNNSIGEGGKFTWLTSQQGTGKYETYMYKVECGDSGSFLTFGHFAFIGGIVGTVTNPVIFDVAYATMLDLAKYDDTADNSLALSELNKNDIANLNTTTQKLEGKTNFLVTKIDGNVVSTGTLLVGDANGNPKAGLTGVASYTNMNLIRDRRVVFWSGTGFAQRESAAVQIWDDGTVVMENARIKGDIIATSGTFRGRLETNEGYIGSLNITQDTLVSWEEGFSIFLYGKNGRTAELNTRRDDYLMKLEQVQNQPNGWGEDINLLKLRAWTGFSGIKRRLIQMIGGGISGFSLFSKWGGVSSTFDITDESVYIFRGIVGGVNHIGLPTGDNLWDGRQVTIMQAGSGTIKVYPVKANIYLNDSRQASPGGDLHFAKYTTRVTLHYLEATNTWYVLSLLDY